MNLNPIFGLSDKFLVYIFFLQIVPPLMYTDEFQFHSAIYLWVICDCNAVSKFKDTVFRMQCIYRLNHGICEWIYYSICIIGAESQRTLFVITIWIMVAIWNWGYALFTRRSIILTFLLTWSGIGIAAETMSIIWHKNSIGITGTSLILI